jgi:hypothetical protein
MRLARIGSYTLRLSASACLWLAAACTGVHAPQNSIDERDPALEDTDSPAASSAQGDHGAPVGADRPSAAPGVEPNAQPSASTPAISPAPLFLLESSAGLRVMDGERVVAELPALAEPAPFGGLGVTQLVTTAKFALIVHTIARPWDATAVLDDGTQLPPGSAYQLAMLVRRSDWRVLWQRRSELLADLRTPRLGSDGQAVFEEFAFERSQPHAVVIAQDGQARVIEGVAPLSAPDADGWLAVQIAAETMSPWAVYGFARAGEPAPRQLSAPLHVPPPATEGRIDPTPVVEPDASLHYISDDGGELVLVHDRPDASESIGLGRAPDGEARLLPGRSAWLVTSFDPFLFVERPWLAVDREGGEARAVTVPDADDVSYVSPARGDWFAVSYERDHQPRGWLNAATGRWLPTPEPPAGQRPLATEYCGSASVVLDDGRVLVGLRDDAIGGMFLVDAAARLTQIGAPIRDAVYVEAVRAGDTWQLSAIAPGRTYCPEPSWPAPAPAADVLLRGGQTQLVRGARSLVIDEGSHVALLEPNGHYAVVSSDETTVLHDLERGSARELPAGTRVVGWF